MASKIEKQSAVHEALVSFPLWVEHSLKPAIMNVIELQKARPKDLSNTVIKFAVPRAMNHVVERSVLDVVQAWELLNIELERQGRRTIGVSNSDYRHLKKIRNKLIAHSVENSVKSKRHKNWYKTAYGSYESVLLLIERAADRVADKIQSLERSGVLFSPASSVQVTELFSKADVESVFEALKAKAIY